MIQTIKDLSIQSESIRYEVEKLNRLILSKKEIQANLVFTFEKSVNFSVDLKNETQRKTALKDMLSSSDDYQKITRDIQEIEISILDKEHERNLIKIEIDFNKNLLAVELKA